MNRLKDKTVLITGATSGIGKACAEQFAEYGCNLILTGRRSDLLNQVTANIKSSFDIEVKISVFDVREEESVLRFVKSVSQPIDILINNAGLAIGADPVQAGDMEDWNVMMDTNVKGLLAMIRYFTPGMIERNSGHIINLGSIAGHEAYPGGVVYCATKHAVKAITEATKKDLHGTKVRVSMVSPGLVETEFSNIRFKGDQEKANSVYKGINPLTANDIAEIIVFTANRPDHVNILDTVVMPVNQSSSQMVYRDE